MRKLALIGIIGITMCSCRNETVQDSRALDVRWEYSVIYYTAPDFYMDDYKYKSDVNIHHTISIANRSANDISVDAYKCVYEVSPYGRKLLVPFYSLDAPLLIKAYDSIQLPLIGNIKFRVDYTPFTSKDSIYNRGSEDIQLTKLFFVNHQSDTTQITKSGDFQVDDQMLYY